MIIGVYGSGRGWVESYGFVVFYSIDNAGDSVYCMFTEIVFNGDIKMKISTSVMYALASAGYIAKNGQDGPVKAATITKEYGIPMDYLQRILLFLVRGKVLKSKRGPRGGFSLACDPKEITILQIFESVDGPLMKDLPMAELTHGAKFSLKMERICKNATEKEMKVYETAKLSDML